MKKCTKCGIEKEESEFYKSNESEDGLRSHCKQCHKACGSADYQKNRDLILERQKIYREQHKERVKACSSACYQKNRDLKLKKCKIYREQNKERVKACVSTYYQKNRDLIIEKTKIYKEHRRKSDPVFYLRCKIQRSISLALQNKNYTKRSRTHEILGCSFIEFKEHIEKQFVNGLSWENRHEWHIDRVIPISSAKTEEEVIRLNHYTNLQPLWAVDNLKKRDKMPDLA